MTIATTEEAELVISKTEAVEAVAAVDQRFLEHVNAGIFEEWDAAITVRIQSTMPRIFGRYTFAYNSGQSKVYSFIDKDYDAIATTEETELVISKTEAVDRGMIVPET